MKITYSILLLFTLVILTSCNRDREAPTINISSPADGLQVAPGDVFFFEATVTDNEGINTIVLSDGGGINESERDHRLELHSPQIR